ncbi:ligand-dependent corepressor isoform X2 [Ascaphus truei]|uniref:ligand-dependent corepressor isoform X2 n=1 Tax=Ascaphus truei TaxID=8439 RepID=UPI003F5AB102
MASLCKSQQCSIERRGFRQELDSWRYKLIHCVGFESILEGLFGPGLLQDLSLFKDFEPTGVCDWSFDENCLFCCLRREKVKEHLAGLHKPVTEAGQETLLKQEQAKIIRLERQAEEFLNAVFYKKDSPRVSDPNIPLVAREIMQRMIRQFAAEYTSKNISTQDSIQPNSTKNQSLPKPTPGQTSPFPATTQNPVLSKLLMADQDSPLDLTVKKSPSEEPCEQDGVLDLSTKKSPCSGSTSSSVSPSTSNTIGNGMQRAETKVIDPNNSTKLTLEKFMVKLCTHHQKQFTHVLNNLCTEEPLSESENITTSISSSVSNLQNSDIEHNDCTHSQNKSTTSVLQVNKSDSQSSINKHSKPVIKRIVADSSDEQEYHGPIEYSADRSRRNISTASGEMPTERCTMTANARSLHVSPFSVNQGEQTVEKEHVPSVKNSEENNLTTRNMTGCAKCETVSHKNDGSESCIVSQKNSGRGLSNDAWDSEFIANLPRIVDKENALQTSPKATLSVLDTHENDCKLKYENSLHTVVTNKVGNHLNHSDNNSFENFQNLRASSVPALRKTRLLANVKPSKSTRKCRRTPALRINDYDNQCDIVYISQPITECHFENQRTILYSRNTARKSTRGYVFSGDCCELSTVRTLVRRPKIEEKGNCTAQIPEALIIPKLSMISETLPSATEVISVAHPEENILEINPFKFLPQSDACSEKRSDLSCNEPEIELEHSLVMSDQSLVSNSGPLLLDLQETEGQSKEVICTRSSTVNGCLKGHEECTKPIELEDVTENIDSCFDFVTGNVHKNSIQDFDTKTLIDITDLNESVAQSDSASPLDNADIEISVEHTTVLPYFDSTIQKSSNELTPLKVILGESPGTLEDSGTNPESRSISLSNEIGVQESASLSSEFSSDLKDSETLYPISTCSVDIPGGSRVERTEDPASQSNRIGKEKSVDNISGFCSSVTNSETFQVELKRSIPGKNSNGGSGETTTQEEVFPLFVNCAKMKGNACTEVETEVLIDEEVQKCDTVITNGGLGQDGVEELTETKTVSSEESNDKGEFIKLNNSCKYDEIKNLIDMSQLKKENKVPATSDRRLRSQQFQEPIKSTVLERNTPFRMKVPCLQVKLCKIPSTEDFQRVVKIRSTTYVNFATDYHPNFLNLSDTNADEDFDCDQNNSTSRKTLCNITQEKPEVSESMFNNVLSSAYKLSENIEIRVDTGSKERKVQFFLQNKKDGILTVEDKLCCKETHNLENQCNFEPNDPNKVLAVTTHSISSSRSRIKHMASRTLMKHKRLALRNYNLRHLSTENSTKQSIRIKKPIECTAPKSEVCLLNTLEVNGTDNEKDRTTFVDWCSEEDNQERISNFNNKYMSIHKGWIPLEKEVPFVHKSKNKSDKLKEIWKTKKRVRKSRKVQEAKKNSPIQQLFMNAFKLSDICRWFLETTETKSLVIVKQLNTPLHEHLILPMIPLQKYPSCNLYPHTLQAERLKKHLKKFASVIPARYNSKTRNALAKIIENKTVQLDEVPKEKTCQNDIKQDTNDIRDIEPSVNLNTPASVRILRKYNIRGKLRLQSATVKTKKRENVINTVETKTNCKNQSVKAVITPKLSLQVTADAPTPKLVVSEERRKGKKRCKEDQMKKSCAQPRKKRKTEIKPMCGKNMPGTCSKGTPPAKKAIKKVKKLDSFPKPKTPKKQIAKVKICKASKNVSLKKKTKTVVKKHSRKTQLTICKVNKNVQKNRVKPRRLPTKSSKPRTTRACSSRTQKITQKKTNGKTHSKSKKNNKSTVSQQKRKRGSESDSPNCSKKRSIDVKS